MENLKICGLNFDINWNNKELNFKNIAENLREEIADLFILPEMFSTGFNMQPEKIADRNEETAPARTRPLPRASQRHGRHHRQDHQSGLMGLRTTKE